MCWDIGASSGIYTLALSRLGARVTVFEHGEITTTEGAEVLVVDAIADYLPGY